MFGRSAKTLYIFWKICQNITYILEDLPKQCTVNPGSIHRCCEKISAITPPYSTPQNVFILGEKYHLKFLEMLKFLRRFITPWCYDPGFTVYILADIPKYIHCFGRSSKILFSLFYFREEKWFDWLLLFSFIFHAVCTLTLTHSLLSSTRFHQ